MKCFPALLLILVVFVGCAAQTPSAADHTQAEQTTITENMGIYDPNSALEAATHGAVRCFPLGSSSCDGILPISDGILLFFTETSATTISKLDPESGMVSAAVEFPFPISLQDASFYSLGGGFSCYDSVGHETIVVDENLQIVSRIPAPEGMTGSPILSADGSTLYYCTATAIRSLDLQTGISRVLKETAYTTQFVSGLHLNDTVVQCSLFDGEETSTLFLSAQTGNTLYVSDNLQEIQTSASHYYASIQEGSNLSWVFGKAGSTPEALIFPAADTCGYMLPDNHAAIGMQRLSSGKVVLNYFELESGLRTASITLKTETLPRSFVSLQKDYIWFLSYDPSYGCDTLYCWNSALSSVTDSADYTGPYFTREMPDDESIAQCIQYAQELGARYGVEILVYQDADDVQPQDYRLTYEHLAPVLMHELQQLEKSLGNYPEGFLETIAQRFDGLTICILRSLSEISNPGSPDTTNGIQFWDGHHAYIALAAGTDTQRSLYHELCHLIDTIVLNESSAYDTWNQLNPTGFEYDYDYAANLQRNSTAYLQDSARYFVDMYSMSFPKEDRARIMEFAMTAGNASLFQADAMQAKLKTLCSGIREAFQLKDRKEEFLWEQYLHTPLAPSA